MLILGSGNIQRLGSWILGSRKATRFLVARLLEADQAFSSGLFRLIMMQPDGWSTLCLVNGKYLMLEQLIKKIALVLSPRTSLTLYWEPSPFRLQPGKASVCQNMKTINLKSWKSLAVLPPPSSLNDLLLIYFLSQTPNYFTWTSFPAPPARWSIPLPSQPLRHHHTLPCIRITWHRCLDQFLYYKELDILVLRYQS